MSHKMLAKIAILMVIVFGAITILYPRLYSPEGKTPVDAAPTAPIAK